MKYGPQQLAAIHGRLARGDVSGALSEIAQAVAREPGNPQAWHLAGVIRRRSQAHSDAIDAFERARALGLQSAEMENSRALSLEALDRLGEAIEAIDLALSLDADYAPAIANRGRLLAASGLSGEALEWLAGSCDSQPRSALIRNAYAALLRETGAPAAAAEQYRIVLAGNPANGVAVVRLGEALRDAGQAAAAAAHYADHAHTPAATPEFAESRAGALLDAGDPAGACAVLEASIAARPDHFPSHRALARLAREHGVGGDPWRSYRAVAARWPAEAAIWRDWLAQMVSFREYKLVPDIAAQAARSSGAHPEFALYAAIALGETGAADAAAARFAALEPVLGDEPAYLVARARHALRQKNFALAERLAARAAERDRRNVFAWAYLGLAWRMTGDEREAWLFDYQRHVRQAPLAYLAEPDAMAELIAVLRSLHGALHHPPEQSLRGGTQTAGALFARGEPAIARLMEAVTDAVEDFARSLPADRGHPFLKRNTGRVRMVGSWSVRLRGEGFHIAHLHTEGWLSSALHLVVPPADDTRPDAGSLVLGEPPAELDLGIGPRRTIVPQPGSLVLFPAAMWHGTVPFAGDHERLSVAFDAVPA